MLDWGGSTRRHEIKIERIKALASDLAISDRSEATLRMFDSRRLAIEAAEPGVYHAAAALAWNATYLGLSRAPERAHLIEVDAVERHLRHVRRYAADRFTSRAERHAEPARAQA